MLTGDGIDVSCQVRTEIVGDDLVTYDANGAVDRSVSRGRAVYPDTMRSAGVIPVDDNFARFCGRERFDETVQAVMRYSAHLISNGYGDDPSDVVSWFSDIGGVSFLDGVTCRFISDSIPFTGLIGLESMVGLDGSGWFTAKVFIRDGCVDMPIHGKNTLVSFLVSTVPC